jgi:phosphate transport system substrate-binding protein
MIITVVCVTMALATGAYAAADKAFEIKGAGLLSGVVQQYLDAYADSQDCPGVIVGATTGKGFKAFLAGTADVVMASRAMNDKETAKAAEVGIDAQSKQIGYVCVAIVTSPDVTVSELTMEQLRKIFTGEIANWKDVGGPDAKIRVTTRAVPETGTGVVFQNTILKGAPYAPESLIMRSYGTTASVCSKGYSIGYIPVTSAYFTKGMEAKSFKVLGVKTTMESPGLYPEEGPVLSSAYPVTIPFHLYWNANNNSQCVVNFADYVVNNLAPRYSTPTPHPAASVASK